MTLSERGAMYVMVVAVAGGDAGRVDIVRFSERNKRKNKKPNRATPLGLFKMRNIIVSYFEFSNIPWGKL